MIDPQHQFDVEAPSRLSEAFQAAYQHRVGVPSGVDEAILAAARARFDRRQRTRLLVRWTGAVAAAAAAIIVIVLILPHRNTAPVNTAVAKTVKGDIDQSGQLDILDAMTLARHLRASDPPQPAWDVNGDGKADQKDVEALAAAAVNLNQQGLARRRLPTMEQLGLERFPAPQRLNQDPSNGVILSAAKDLGTGNGSLRPEIPRVAPAPRGMTEVRQ
jgi:hypothetical protein